MADLQMFGIPPADTALKSTGQQQPNGLGGFLQGDAFGNLLTAAGISLMSSPRNAPLSNFGPALGNAQTAMFRQQQADQEAAQREAEKQRRAELSKYAMSVVPSNLQSLAQADPESALKIWEMSRPKGIDPTSAPSNVQEWQYYSSLSPEDQSRYLTMKRSNSPLNIGTGFVTQDPANPGTTLGAPIAIENRQAAYDTGYGGVEGKSDAESAALAESIQSKMPGLRVVIDDLTRLADTATYTQSGQAMDSIKRELGLPVGQGAIDRSSYIAIVDNQVLPLLRDTFGSAFTQKEGESLRATLGDPNKSPAEKKAILEAFISQKERDVAAMLNRRSSDGGAMPAGQTGGIDDLLTKYQ